MLQEYKCPCCDGGLIFDTKTQKMKCPYCDSVFDVASLREYDTVLDAGQENRTQHHTWSEGEMAGLRSYVCKSCGGQIIGDETLAASKCPYCNNPIVMMGQFAGDLRPDCIIPFQLDKTAAKEGLKEHMSGRPLLPKVFISENHIDEIKGIYVPFWLYDTDVDASINYNATKVHHWSDEDYDYTETEYYDVYRQGCIAFDNVPVDGSKKIDDALMESIEPYEFCQATDFQTAYLAGYMADKYDIGLEASLPRARHRIQVSTEDAFRSTVMGYNTVYTSHSDIQMRDDSAKYALYPVWLLNTTWNSERYRFAMNGQSGKFVGNLPIDKGRALAWHGGWTIAFTVICYFLLNYLQGRMDSDILSSYYPIFSIVIGILLGICVIHSMIAEMRNVRMQHGAANYVRPGSMVVNSSYDRFLYSHVTKTPRPKANRKDD